MMNDILHIRKTCSACPIQYEGQLATGESFYFRARWGHWWFGVGPGSVNEAVRATMFQNERFPDHYTWHERFSDDDYAGWMPHSEAMMIIEQCIKEYQEATQ